MVPFLLLEILEALRLGAMSETYPFVLFIVCPVRETFLGRRTSGRVKGMPCLAAFIHNYISGKTGLINDPRGTVDFK